MSRYLRKSVYLCRAPLCKHKNIVWQWVDADENLIETAPAWTHQCGKCRRSSLDLTYQKTFKPEPNPPSAPRDQRRIEGSDPTT
jgi:hypothetical protein